MQPTYPTPVLNSQIMLPATQFSAPQPSTFTDKDGDSFGATEFDYDDGSPTISLEASTPEGESTVIEFYKHDLVRVIALLVGAAK
jgi:hypothetical protein